MHRKLYVICAGLALTAPYATAQETGSIAPGYDQAFVAWRACAAEHQREANPPAPCEALRSALRRAMVTRQRVGTR